MADSPVSSADRSRWLVGRRYREACEHEENAVVGRGRSVLSAVAVAYADICTRDLQPRVWTNDQPSSTW